jgi:S1-C subfamily serine protease
MSRFALSLLLLFLTCGNFSPAALADYQDAKREFDKYPQETKAHIVIGLITTGDFNGVYDGQFSPRIHAAIESFQSREHFTQTGMLDQAQLDLLLSKEQSFMAPLGIRQVQLPRSHLQVFVPRLVFDDQAETDHGFAFERGDKTISLAVEEYPSSETSFEALFTKQSTTRPPRVVNYHTLQPSYFVSSGEFRGRSFYTWMYRMPMGSAGLTLSWARARDALAQRLAILMVNTFTTGEASAEPKQVPTPPAPQGKTGTGFLISTNGHLITNHHVVDNCDSISIRKPGSPAIETDLIAKNAESDLALLKARSWAGNAVAPLRAGTAIRAGDEIVVYGFPLTGSLASEGNVVAGYVTALSGLEDDQKSMQISAPVQLGNSGGPLLDRSGNVVGVVQSKLDALLVSKQLGDIPQNINFAIRESVLRDFLDWVGERYAISLSLQTFSVSEIRDKAQEFTVLVECRR